MQLVSVIIPTYNRVHTLPGALESVLRQSYSDIEVIVVDDGSTDGTGQYMKRVQDVRVRYIANEQNLGPTAARNRGVSLARGEWVAFLDSDDIWEPDKLEKQVKCAGSSGEKCKMVYCEYAVYQGKSFVGIVPERELTVCEKSGNLLEQLLRGPLIGTVTMLVERKAFLEVGGFSETLKALEDYEFSIRFARYYEIGFIEEPLVKVYDSVVSVNKRWEEQIHTYFYIVQEFWEQLKGFGILWRKLYLIGQESELYGCRSVFEREMCTLMQQIMTEEEKKRAFRIMQGGEEQEEKPLEMQTEEFFVQLEHDQMGILAEKARVVQAVTRLLQQSDTKGMIELNLHFREGEGRAVYIHCSDIQKLYIISNILQMEEQTGVTPFTEGITDYDALLQKYRKVVYYLRRFELSALDDGCLEGIHFFHQESISVIAIHQIMQKEMFSNWERIICRCCDMLAGEDEEMRIGLLLCMAEVQPSAIIMMKVAEWNLEMGNCETALQYLKRVEPADEAVRKLQEELEKILYG